MGARSTVKVRFKVLETKEGEVNARAWDHEDIREQVLEQYPEAIPGTIEVLVSMCHD